MELRHLRYFIAVAEERSFTRAAERLWVAQPGLSRQIRDLERELGAQLFERHPRGVALTAVGELFLERARTASAAVDAARATGRDAEAGVVGTVRLGVSVGTSWHLTASVLDEFAQTRPRVELTLLEGYAGTLWDELRHGHIDALISTSDCEISDRRTSRTLDLGSEPWVVLAGQSHRLAGTGSLQASDLEGEQIAVTSHRDGSSYDRAVAGLLEELGVTAVLTKAAPGPSLQATVARGDTVMLTTAPAELHPGVIARPLHPRQTIGFELLWREDSLSPALAEFVRLTAERLDASTHARPPLAAVA
jgi:DNA-binding transcriptional LysR family regulator